ncbi:hypothetical protein Ae406Ps2_4504c [Pseudonocardia sp. Ae406_Ps2]|nr:hypothetical protein Ae406Ps2_4504c [Pseudonocardia sp. Ae406_Ps2]OLM26073.1 hypothetical protein Ae706Ps2_4506c [Pseudonocardia sp. Ae706_Ps2]
MAGAVTTLPGSPTTTAPAGGEPRPGTLGLGCTSPRFPESARRYG